MAPILLQPNTKCPWCIGDPLMEAYHDHEWGVPVTTDAPMFEHLVLEAFQSGLSWRTVLHKREAFRAALCGFDAESLLSFSDADREAFLANPLVIRNRLKLDATLHNARVLVSFRDRHGQGFADYLWNFVGGRPLDGAREGSWPATTKESDELSKALKSEGFKFIGSTTVYAHMQATGMVNDHWMSCPRYVAVKALAQTL
jgi:DNA-3-methyladenine glycosylase I